LDEQVNQVFGSMKRRVLGTSACVVGLVGVIAAVLAFHVVAPPPDPPPGWEVQVNVTKHLKWRFGNRLEPAPEPATLVSYESLKLAGVIIGCVAIALAVASWIRREGATLGFVGCFLGVSAIAWETVLVVFAIFMFVGGPVIWFDRPWSARRETTAAT
jgi:hypothetical protein